MGTPLNRQESFLDGVLQHTWRGSAPMDLETMCDLVGENNYHFVLSIGMQLGIWSNVASD